jgi:hypothetical protein
MGVADAFSETAAGLVTRATLKKNFRTPKGPTIVLGSYYLPRHSWPSPPIFVPIAIFLSCFVPPFWVSLSLHCARKLRLLKSLFLD